MAESPTEDLLGSMREAAVAYRAAPPTSERTAAVVVPEWVAEAAETLGLDLQAEFDDRARRMGFAGARLVSAEALDG